MKKPKICFFDIETAPLKAWVWGLGEQSVRHHQLCEGFKQYGVICISYCINDGDVMTIHWGYEEQDSAKVIKEFDKVVNYCDHFIGKNSDRFDVKMINAIRMLNNLPGIPEWMKYTDDLEKQLRKYFRLPSYTLDYISDQFGLGGKIKMEFSDWIDIVEKTENGQDSFEKMIIYNQKDVEDTRTLWYKLCQHFEPKLKPMYFQEWDQKQIQCRHTDCLSTKVRKNGTRVRGKTRYQAYVCKDCGRYIDEFPINSKINKDYLGE